MMNDVYIHMHIHLYRSHQKVDEGKNLGLGILYTGYLQKQNPSSGNLSYVIYIKVIIIFYTIYNSVFENNL